MLLLNHAAADCNYLLRFIFFRVRERPKITENAHLRVLAHSTGVDYDKVCRKFVFSHFKTHLAEVSADFFAVLLVLLAAKCLNKSKAALTLKARPYIGTYVQLFFYFLG